MQSSVLKNPFEESSICAIWFTREETDTEKLVTANITQEEEELKCKPRSYKSQNQCSGSSLHTSHGHTHPIRPSVYL
jgi:hypothetical protein